MNQRLTLMLALQWLAATVAAASTGDLHATTPAELAVGAVIVKPEFPELDIRRYGAVCDYDERLETAGQAAVRATDNLPAFNTAIAVAAERGGGTILVDTRGDCYVSNTIDAKGIDNLWFDVAPGTIVRATRYTRMGSLFALGNTADNPAVRNVGIRGGGAVRTFRPQHARLPSHRVSTAYALGTYVISIDKNGEKRAYYAKRGGVSGPSSPPDAINGADTDGTVMWQDADNDNVISLSGIGVSVIGMSIPEASGKPITVQTPNWSGVLIKNNVIGSTNDKAIEVKGQQGFRGQEQAFGDGVNIVGNSIENAGREGIEIEQSMHAVNLNRNCHIVGNVVRSAGSINQASGIRVNRCDGVEIRGNRVVNAAGNGYHLRLSRNISGDLWVEEAGKSGVHLQQVEGFSFDRVRVGKAAGNGVTENGCSLGGEIGELTVESARVGYQTLKRAGPAPRIGAYRFSSLSGVAFSGAKPDATARQSPSPD
jgi:hypothetical protein